LNNSATTSTQKLPAVYNVPAGRPFLDCLARAILAGDLPRPGGPVPDMLDLPNWTILLPTRRAARAFQDAFLRASSGRAMLMPRVRPIAEAQEDLSLLSGLASLDTLGAGHAEGADASDVPMAISEIERRLVLTRLVMQWSAVMRKGAEQAASEQADGDLLPVASAGAGTPAQAAALAKELASLMDAVETENVSLDLLKGLVPETFSEHWQKTLQFLEIVLAWWPEHLKDRALISGADRRNRLIMGEARRLASHPPSGPVIVAGVTGSIPATAELMRVVATLDQGAIVLPGLDPGSSTGLDEASWQVIDGTHSEHPQYGLRKLLGLIGVTRDDVKILPGAEPTAVSRLREKLVSEALRPAATTDLWHTFTSAADPASVRAALAGVSSLQAATAQDEAEMVALILRHVVETPGKTAALVSPDRLLARRVATRLEAWGIRVDDSAGRPFAKTVPGAYLDLVIECAAQDFAPSALVPLLKHPLTRMGLPAFEIRRAARSLEIAAFRTVYLGRGLIGVDKALERANDEIDQKRRRGRAVNGLGAENWGLARDLVQRLEAAFLPLIALFTSYDEHTLEALARAHVATAEALCQLPAVDAGPAAPSLFDADPSSPLWAREAGQSASMFFASVMDPNLPAPTLKAIDYPDFYRALIAGENVRPRVPVHPRLSIWGPFEARLQQPDVVILGSLNEGTWPEAADPGPWLNRPMRAELKLPQPEEKIGYAAHDFTQLLGGAQVIMTRAEKMDGVPTVASRWLLRLNALLDGMSVRDCLEPDLPWTAWSAMRDSIPKPRRITVPEPRPPLALRPRKMSVSDVESWMANPYAIYASKILRLEAMPALGLPPDASLRGSIIHQALGKFAEQFPDKLPTDIFKELMAIASSVLVDFTGNARVAAFWLPRFERFADWFADTEPGRRQGVARVAAEVSGREIFDLEGGTFTLTARADRIDLVMNGIGAPDGLVITDYKTGNNLKHLAGRAVSGEAPQLPLEALIAAGMGFDNVAAQRVRTLRYISASGGEPAGDAVDVKADDISVLANKARAGLVALVNEYDDLETPYKPLRRQRFTYEYDDFTHLARVAEWSGEIAPPDETDETAVDV
jgi:ATP-dependent helicase/nuclease subunit B